MVMYYYAIDRWVKPVINRNVNAGRAEADREWDDWLARKEEAESQGLPFDEPPPSARR